MSLRILSQIAWPYEYNRIRKTKQLNGILYFEISRKEATP